MKTIIYKSIHRKRQVEGPLNALLKINALLSKRLREILVEGSRVIKTASYCASLVITGKVLEPVFIQKNALRMTKQIAGR